MNSTAAPRASPMARPNSMPRRRSRRRPSTGVGMVSSLVKAAGAGRLAALQSDTAPEAPDTPVVIRAVFAYHQPFFIEEAVLDANDATVLPRLHRRHRRRHVHQRAGGAGPAGDRTGTHSDGPAACGHGS